MSLQSSSVLFLDRASLIGASDVGYALERHLHTQLHSDRVYCKVKNDGKIITIRVGSPLLVEQLTIRLHDIFLYVRQELGCDVADIRVMLE